MIRPAAKTTVRSAPLVRLEATQNNIDDTMPLIPAKCSAAAFGALVTVSQPLIALAEDNYEYGAVSAPPFVPIVGGLLAILTALLPIALRGGEEAFEEMKGQGEFGEDADPLKSKRR